MELDRSESCAGDAAPGGRSVVIEVSLEERF